MIKFEHTEVMNMDNALRGMRNPLNSWDKGDSGYMYSRFIVGDNDMALMKRLTKAGTDHRKFLRQIFVSVDITAPMYWWSEFDTYKVGTVANSTSKMHKLLSKPFEMNDFSFDQLFGYKNEVSQFRPLIDEEIVACEKWITIDENYDISNYGRVKHKFKNHYRIISGSLHKDGYVFVTINGKQHLLHKLVAMNFLKDTYKKGLVVNHKDGNKQNNFADNLEWVTQQENIKHSYDNNLQPKNLNTYKGKFTQEQREEIKYLWDEGKMSKRAIAKKYNVSHTCINDIINDKYKYTEKVNVYEEVARPLVDTLNEMRDSWFKCENEYDKKKIWYSILQLLPNSYNQLRTVTLNYEILINQYFARRNHKLDEWHTYCEWIESLPYMNKLIDVLEE